MMLIEKDWKKVRIPSITIERKEEEINYNRMFHELLDAEMPVQLWIDP